MHQRDSLNNPHAVTYTQLQDVDSWHEIICSTFSRTEYQPSAETDFRGELSAINLGEARMACIQSSGGWFGRSASAIRNDHFDGFMILMAQNGELRLSQGEDRYLARHGEALIYRHGAPFELDIPAKYRALSLWVSPHVMRRQCPDLAGRKSAVLLRRDTANGALALAMIDNLCTGAVTRQTREIDRLVAATLDVVSTILEPEEVDTYTDLRDKLKHFALRHIDDTDLTVDGLARAMSVSPRTLNRALGQLGTTPMRWLMELRLTEAHEALLHSRMRNVTEAAFAFGFKDVAHFSRSFSRHFGFAPSQLLRRS